MALRVCVIGIFLTILFSCKDDFEKKYTWHHIKVTATAYNSVKNQTDSDPHITAFGDSLKPGLKYIAVSNDLIKKGLKHDTPVKIKGLEGIYFVKDKMHSRKRNHIDIYMGIDVKAAKHWGRKKVSIVYGVLKETP
ncbi:MAG: 3D domain-containing protein [Flavobacteriaceae bacterium]|jgi:3D (Asp-Asp-Asp) domain-containing protein|nr:3D domain-containing protein [Flavobacteriaceae bacterium]